jgi:hypothetical protein
METTQGTGTGSAALRFPGMKGVVGSVIARLGSKRLPYKNLLPFEGVPLVRMGVLRLLECPDVDQVVLSTESELIARQVADLDVIILRRPEALSGDRIPSIPVFQHIVSCFPCEVHLNYNINFPVCPVEAMGDAIRRVRLSRSGEVLSRPFALWAQTARCLANYGDPWKITAEQYDEPRIREPDVHTETELLAAHRLKEPLFERWWNQG